MKIKMSRSEAWKSAKEIRVQYQVSMWGQEWETKEHRLSRSVIAQSMYRLQTTDLLEAAEYAMFWIVVGGDDDDIGLGGIAII